MSASYVHGSVRCRDKGCMSIQSRRGRSLISSYVHGSVRSRDRWCMSMESGRGVEGAYGHGAHRHWSTWALSSMDRAAWAWALSGRSLECIPWIVVCKCVCACVCGVHVSVSVCICVLWMSHCELCFSRHRGYRSRIHNHSLYCAQHESGASAPPLLLWPTHNARNYLAGTLCT